MGLRKQSHPVLHCRNCAATVDQQLASEPFKKGSRKGLRMGRGNPLESRRDEKDHDVNQAKPSFAGDANFCLLHRRNGSATVDQQLDRLTHNQEVGGANPPSGTFFYYL